MQIPSKPFFSVIIPVYNLEEYISFSVQSVLEQKFSDFELIIVDDRSTDNTFKIVSSFSKSDNRVKVLVNKRLQGAAGSRNTGLIESNGKWICFLDGDDIWLPNHLQERHTLINQIDDVDLVSSDFFVWFDLENRTIAKHKESSLWKSIYEKNHRTGDIYYDRNVLDLFILNGVVTHTNVITIKHEILKKAGFFEENLPVFEDVHLWLRLAKQSNCFAYIPKQTAYYRQRNGSLSKNEDSFYKYAPLMYKDLMDNHDFHTFEKVINGKITETIQMNTYYYRKNKRKIQALISAWQGFRHSPFDKRLLRNLFATIIGL